MALKPPALRPVERSAVRSHPYSSDSWREHTVLPHSARMSAVAVARLGRPTFLLLAMGRACGPVAFRRSSCHKLIMICHYCYSGPSPPGQHGEMQQVMASVSLDQDIGLYSSGDGWLTAL